VSSIVPITHIYATLMWLACFSSLFAFSVGHNIMGGNLVWFVLALVALSGAIASCRIPSDRKVLDPESTSSSEASSETGSQSS
jgi:hypothetical protein